MREKLKEILKRETMAWMDSEMHLADFLCDRLLDAGVLVPPAQLGDTLYAIYEGDEGLTIAPFHVFGLVYERGRWYIIDDCADTVAYGSKDALPTREDAERMLQEIMEGAER